MPVAIRNSLDEHVPDWFDELTPAQRWAWIGLCHATVKKQFGIGTVKITGIAQQIGVSQNDFDTMFEVAKRHDAVEWMPGFASTVFRVSHIAAKHSRHLNQNRQKLALPGAVSHAPDFKPIAAMLPRGDEPAAVMAVKAAIETITDAQPGCDGAAVLRWLIEECEPCGQLESPIDYMERLVHKITGKSTFFKNRLADISGQAVIKL